MPAIRNFTRKTPSAIPYKKIKKVVLGERYDLSLAFIGSTRSRRLNRKYRGKDKPANVLSFPFSKTDGEMLIDLAFARDKKNTAILFIHGLFHLKGMDHGSIMERSEARTLAQFSFNTYATQHRNRNRRRNILSARRRL